MMTVLQLPPQIEHAHIFYWLPDGYDQERLDMSMDLLFRQDKQSIVHLVHKSAVGLKNRLRVIHHTATDPQDHIKSFRDIIGKSNYEGIFIVDCNVLFFADMTAVVNKEIRYKEFMYCGTDDYRQLYYRNADIFRLLESRESNGGYTVNVTDCSDDPIFLCQGFCFYPDVQGGISYGKGVPAVATKDRGSIRAISMRFHKADISVMRDVYDKMVKELVRRETSPRKIGMTEKEKKHYWKKLGYSIPQD